MKISQKITELWVIQKRFGGKLSKGHNWKTKQGEQSILHAVHRLYLIHIPIKLHEYIINSE